MKRKFVAYYWFVGWEAISLGISIDVSLPNFEIHLPTGFIRIGWVKVADSEPLNWRAVKSRGFGLQER
jgi:hypothetical protein